MAWAGDNFFWTDQSKPVLETYATSPYHSNGAATLSEGTANLIWVKCGAQSLPISLDLINPNRVIVFDDKEVSMREPHCQIIVLLPHSAQSKVDKGRPAANMDYWVKQRSYIIVNGGRVLDTCTEKLSINNRHKMRTLSYNSIKMINKAWDLEFKVNGNWCWNIK